MSCYSTPLLLLMPLSYHPSQSLIISFGIPSCCRVLTLICSMLPFDPGLDYTTARPEDSTS
ncbi:uncharacterized protein RAG0_03515 [Rhynchosporium agropyri]|uniref:Uncharacterized protein n=1 Tax=Rhynchosporium agropyri TaxID=914238 RepID=A0A1E1K4L7_9HELO|nr:uncharacterized protein RAG0_03515 [Rhynchosporium agropyri]